MPVVTLQHILVSIVCYLIGSFPTGVVLTKRKYGIDVREMGSGNIGATNVTRVFGWYAGAITLVIDLAKSFFPLLYLKSKYPEDAWVLTIAAISLVLGHCFSLFLKFRGGKGVATGLGTVAVVAPWCAVIAAAVYCVVILLTKVSALGSLAGIFSCIVYLFIVRPEASITVLIASVCFVVTTQHTSNIKRLLEKRLESK